MIHIFRVMDGGPLAAKRSTSAHCRVCRTLSSADAAGLGPAAGDPALHFLPVWGILPSLISPPLPSLASLFFYQVLLFAGGKQGGG